jgi:hypothetical protein
LCALSVEVNRLGRESLLNAFLQLVVAVGILTGKKSLQVRVQEVAQCTVRAVGSEVVVCARALSCKNRVGGDYLEK